MSFNFSSQDRKSSKNIEEREKLLKVIHEENEILTKLAEEFYAVERRDDEVCASYSRKVIEIVDRIVSAGDWESSLFLRNMIKPIKKIKEQAEEILFNLGSSSDSSEEGGDFSINDDEVIVYVSLFQAQGARLSVWEMQLRSIESHLITRPIYDSEKAVQRALRGNVNASSFAYAILRINKSSIEEPYSSADERFDRLGQKIVLIKSGTVSSENIVGFFHDDSHYYFRNNRLVLRK